MKHCSDSVVDEAHRGSGNYAYAQIVRSMTQVNPFFRVLALTATPGNTIEKVQEIVDSLHISHIEIRNEDVNFELTGRRGDSQIEPIVCGKPNKR